MPTAAKFQRSKRRELEDLESRAAKDRFLDIKSVIIGLVIFALIGFGAYLWRTCEAPEQI